MKKSFPLIYYLLFGAGSAVIIALLLIFWLYYPTNRLNSDMASELVLASHLAESNQLLSREWYYSTDLRLIHIQLIASILFKVTNSWQSVRFFTIFILMVLCGASFLFLGKSIKLNKLGILFGEFLLLIPYSYTQFTVMQYGGGYYPHIILTFILLGCFFRREKIYLLLWVIISFVFGLNGIRCYMTLFLPLLCSEFVINLLYNRKKGFGLSTLLSDSSFIRACIGAFSAGIGITINEVVLRHYYTFAQNSLFYRSFKESENTLFDLFGNSLMGILEVLGYKYNIKVFSFYGILNGCIMLGCIALTVILFQSGRRWIQGTGENCNVKLTLTFVLFWGVLAHIFIFVFTTQQYSSRYWILVLVILIPLACFPLDNIKSELSFQKIGILFVFFCSLCIGAFSTITYMTYKENESRCHISQYLQSKGIDLAYSTFWNANVITELTNGNVKMIPLTSDMHLYEWLTKKDFYLEDRKECSTAIVLLETSEIDQLEISVLSGAGSEIYRDENYVIYSFDKEVLETSVGMPSQLYSF